MLDLSTPETPAPNPETPRQLWVPGVQPVARRAMPNTVKRGAWSRGAFSTRIPFQLYLTSEVSLRGYRAAGVSSVHSCPMDSVEGQTPPHK